MARRLTITPSKKPALTVTRRAVRSRKLVYIICAPRPRGYPKRKSRVIYIGTTEKGVHRVAASAAGKAVEFLEDWGVRQLDIFLITCPPRPGRAAWIDLERDLLITFVLEYGGAPKGNTSGKNLTPDRLSRVFNYQRLKRVLKQYEE